MKTKRNCLRFLALLVAMVLLAASATVGAGAIGSVWLEREEPYWKAEGEVETGLSLFLETKKVKMNDGIWSFDLEGLKDASGKIVMPAEFEKITYLGNGLIYGHRCGLKASTKYGTGVYVLDESRDGGGVFTADGTVIVPFQYTEAEVIGDTEKLIRVRIGGTAINDPDNRYQLFDRYGNQVLYDKYQSIISVGEGYYTLKNEKGLVGVYKYGTGVVIPFQYKNICYLSGGYFSVMNSSGSCGVVDAANKTVIPCKYEYIDKYTNGVFIVGKFLDSAVKEQYKKSGELQLWDYLDLKLHYGIVDIQGNLLVPISYDGIGISDEGVVSLGIRNGTYTTSGGGDITLSVQNCDYTKVDLADLSPARFSDVLPTEYYAKPVAWAIDKGITVGTTSTTFSPDSTCTEAQIITFLYRAAGSPAVTGENPLTNVSASDYYYNPTLWAVQEGIIDSSFDPNRSCTRAATVSYMYKYAGSPSVTNTGKFTDVAQGTSVADAVQWALDNGVTTGATNTTFSPDSACTRGQIVTFLYRAFAN